MKLDDLRIYLTDTSEPTLVAIGFGAEAEKKAQDYSRRSGAEINVMAPKDGFELRAKMAPNGMKVEFGPPSPFGPPAPARS